ncbi:MAG: hypothetical protein DWP98_11745 [Bacteroidetes bacterium]|nr:MAG: hypothetical protein DWP98_11745 [Bacteroidota bacterium]
MGCLKLTYYEPKEALEVNANFFGKSLEKNDIESIFCLNAYTYGFSGQERDDEVSGSGNMLNYKFRMYNSRLGRFFAVDPITAQYPWLTPYQHSSLNPIGNNEIEGLEGRSFHKPGSPGGFDKSTRNIVTATDVMTNIPIHSTQLQQLVESGKINYSNNSSNYESGLSIDFGMSIGSKSFSGTISTDGKVGVSSNGATISSGSNPNNISFGSLVGFEESTTTTKKLITGKMNGEQITFPQVTEERRTKLTLFGRTAEQLEVKINGNKQPIKQREGLKLEVGKSIGKALELNTTIEYNGDFKEKK